MNNQESPSPEGHVTVRGAASSFSQTIETRSHRLIADEPVEVGGTDAGPTPYDLLLAALGSCASMTVGLYARGKGWPLQEVAVRLRHSRVHAVDCAECETQEGHIDRIDWSRDGRFIFAALGEGDSDIVLLDGLVKGHAAGDMRR